MMNKIKKTLKSKFLGEYTPSGNKERALIVLIIGFSILIFITILIRINYTNYVNTPKDNNIETESIQFLSLDKLFNNYLDNYNYKIEVIDKDTIYYDGKIENGVNTGTRIVNNNTLNYNLNNDNLNDVYGNYLYYFYTPQNVYDFIKSLNGNEQKLDNNKIYTYNSIYEDNEINFKIITSRDRIEEINYNYKDIYYNIKLS